MRGLRGVRLRPDVAIASRDSLVPVERPRESTPASFEELLCAFEDKVYLERRLSNCQVVMRAVGDVRQGQLLMLILVDERLVPFIMQLRCDSPATSALMTQLTVDRRLTIHAPYFRLFQDGTSGIRVINGRLVELGASNAICWVCLRETQPLLACGRCSRAKYCSEQCQRCDYDDMLHKQECRRVNL